MACLVAGGGASVVLRITRESTSHDQKTQKRRPPGGPVIVSGNLATTSKKIAFRTKLLPTTRPNIYRARCNLQPRRRQRRLPNNLPHCHREMAMAREGGARQSICLWPADHRPRRLISSFERLMAVVSPLLYSSDDTRRGSREQHTGEQGAGPQIVRA